MAVDVMPAVRLITETDPAVQGLVGDRVHVVHLPPDPKVWPALLLTPGPNTSRPAHHDHAAIALVTIEGLGAHETDDETAYDVTQAAWRALLDLRGYRDAEVEVSGVEQAVGIRPLPLDEHRKARAACDARIYAHRSS